MGNEVFIESLLRGETRALPQLPSDDHRRLLGLLGHMIEFYFELDTAQRFTEVTYPLGVGSWFSGDGCLGRSFWELDLSAVLNQGTWREFRRLFRSRAPMRDLGFRLQLADGEIRHYRLHASPGFDHDVFTGYYGVVTDVSQSRFKDGYVYTVEHAAIGIAHINRLGQISFANRRLCDMLGYNHEELLGLRINQLSHPDDLRVVDRQRQASPGLASSSGLRVEKRYRRKDGNYIWMHLNLTEVDSSSEDPGYDITFMEDITDRVKAEENFKYLATHDELTGLPNRMLLTHLLQHALEGAKRDGKAVGVLLIDLDRFKMVIDSLGHAAGDVVLQVMAQRFRSAVRSSDVVARPGGDEFIVLLPQVQSREKAAEIAAILLEKAVEPIVLSGHECRLSASIGIAMFPDDGDDELGLLQRADQALYLAKGEGKNNYQFCPPEIKGVTIGKIRMEALLHQAIEKNEFSLYYQGKVDLQSDTVAGAEALLRWKNDELGEVSPALFIPLAEENELIFQIGEWVLEQACGQLAQWRQQGLALSRIAVNLSPRQFADLQLADKIEAMLVAKGLPGSALELEITEGMVVQRPERALQMLNRIKELGVTVAIDDFGTGFSSLGQLKRFPVDTLKIDRSFIHDLEHDCGDQELTRAIISMAKTLGLSVVAEGVETAGQVAFLRKHGCDLIQGYYFSKPCLASEFASLLRRN